MKIPVRRGILVSLITLLALAIAAVTLAATLTTTDSVETLSQQLMAQLSQSIGKETQRYLTPARGLAEFNAQLFQAQVLQDGDEEAIFNYLEEQARTAPGFANLFVGMADGRFLMVKRFPDGSLKRRYVVHPYLDAMWLEPGEPLPEPGGEPLADGFDPRRRPWYRGAMRAEGAAWTDVYHFDSDRQLGITASAPFYRADGTDLIGVTGTDIGLAALSDFLREEINIGMDEGNPATGGYGFVIDNLGRVIAHPNPNLISGLEPPKAAENSGDAVAQAAITQYRKVKGDARGFPVQEPYFCRVTIDEEAWWAHIAPLDMDGFPEWAIVAVIPEDYYLAPVKRNAFLGGAIIVITTVVALLLSLILTRNISGPILQLENRMSRVSKFDLDVDADIPTVFYEVDSMIHAFDGMVQGLRAFERYVPSDVVRLLLEEGIEATTLGGRVHELTIMFTDIQGFTTIAEDADPQALVEQLGHYLDRVSAAVAEAGGTLDKYIGDAVMAFWNAPREDPEHARHGLLAAIEATKRSQALNASWKAAGKPEFITRIGVATAEVVVGNVGSQHRFNYTALGDGVNLAARLEGINKVYGTGTLTAASTASRVDRAEILLQRVDRIAAKGKAQSTDIYEVVGLAASVPDARKRLAETYERGLDLYFERRFEEALKVFWECESLAAEYRPATLMAARCRDFMKTPPQDDWGGVWVLDQK